MNGTVGDPGPVRSPGLAALAASGVDVLVVGGGITGACIAWEATRRGLATGLVERDDYGAGATANCLKIVHGGLRYLQHLDLRRVRQSALERSFWLRSAPHLVDPLPVLLPTYRGRFPSRSALAAALVLNEVFSADRNRGLLPERRIPRARVLSRRECLALEPSLEHPRLTGGVFFHDALMYSPERLTLEVVQAAAAAGAVAANHVAFEAPILEDGRVAGARLRDRLTGEETEVRARWIINATGSFAPSLAGRLAPRPTARYPDYSVALNFVTRKPAPPVAFTAVTGLGEGARGKKKGRQLFVVPWRDQMMIGTAHLEYRGDPARFELAPELVEEFLAEIATASPHLDLARDDISLVHAGLLPLAGPAGPAGPAGAGGIRLLKHHRIVDHAAEGCPGALSVVTVKLTTARQVAREVMDRIVPAAPAARGPEVALLPGGRFESLHRLRAEADELYSALLPADVLEHLVRTYGAGYAAVLEHRRLLPDWDERVVPGAPVIRAQVAHAVLAEQARTVDDVLWRRTELGPRGLDMDAARQVAERILEAVRSGATPRART
jgi:glycerol-3-phosphate dehydrogenase